MDFDYYDITSHIDAREILRYLNELGVYNISGEMLKHFITDLKKLIKFDLEQKKHNKENEHISVPERLHSASTFSSRSKSKVGNVQGLKCSCTHSSRPIIRSIHEGNSRSAPNLLAKSEDKPLRRACSCIPVPKTDSAAPIRSAVASSANLIKVPIITKKKRSDPVALYHYYSLLWAKYKANVPGENNWSELRWSMRQKMAGLPTEQKTGDRSSKKTENQKPNKDKK